VWRAVKPLLVVMAADLTRDEHGNTRARLLDLVPGRSGSVYRDWLTQRGDTFRAKVKVATFVGADRHEDTQRRGGGSPRPSSLHSRPARSPRSPASAGL